MLPNLIVIGAKKCGTTSLHHYLGLHPQVAMSHLKETKFFVAELNWFRGVDWYKAHFTGDALIRGESSPAYTDYPFYVGVPERMYALIPEAKLIYLVRDPIDRIISNYVHDYAIGRETRAIVDVLANFETHPYVYQSQYFLQLSQYLRFFSPDKIMIVEQQQLEYNRLPTLRRIFHFLGVHTGLYSLGFLLTYHRSKDKRAKTALGIRLSELPVLKLINRFSLPFRWQIEQLLSRPFSKTIPPPVLTDTLRQKLHDHLRPDVVCLRKFTGYALSGWCVSEVNES